MAGGGRGRVRRIQVFCAGREAFESAGQWSWCESRFHPVVGGRRIPVLTNGYFRTPVERQSQTPTKRNKPVGHDGLLVRETRESYYVTAFQSALLVLPPISAVMRGPAEVSAEVSSNIAAMAGSSDGGAGGESLSAPGACRTPSARQRFATDESRVDS